MAAFKKIVAPDGQWYYRKEGSTESLAKELYMPNGADATAWELITDEQAQEILARQAAEAEQREKEEAATHAETEQVDE